MGSLLTKHKTLFVGLIALVAGGAFALGAAHAPEQLVKGASVITPTITATPTVSPTLTLSLTPTVVPTTPLTPVPTRYIAPTKATTKVVPPTAAQSGVNTGAQTHSSAPAGASAICGDGTYSLSQHRSGTCSHHGGVSQWL